MLRSPSKFLSRKALKDLRDNHYTSKSGVEYCPEEVDQLYFEKCNKLLPNEIETELNNHWSYLNSFDDFSYRSNELSVAEVPF